MSRRISRSSCWGRFLDALRVLLPVVVLTVAFAPETVRACAVCYGQSDSPMAAGMNWGIMSLLVIIVSVLAGVAAFFVFLAKRSATASRTAAVDDLLQPVSRNNYG